MLEIIIEKLKQPWGANYVRLLEEEVSRLRAENRALMNSPLGTAGFPPVQFPEAPKTTSRPRKRSRTGLLGETGETSRSATKIFN